MVTKIFENKSFLQPMRSLIMHLKRFLIFNYFFGVFFGGRGRNGGRFFSPFNPNVFPSSSKHVPKRFPNNISSWCDSIRFSSPNVLYEFPILGFTAVTLHLLLLLWRVCFRCSSSWSLLIRVAQKQSDGAGASEGKS